MDPFEDLFDRCDSVSRKNLDRWQRAVRKAQANSYKADDFFKDAMSAWLDSTLGLWFGELESVALTSIVSGIDAAQGTTKVSAPAAGDPASTDLVLMERGPKPVNNPTDPIPAADVVTELSADRKTLRVTLGKLKNLKAEAGAVYAGIVTVGGDEIAKIRAVVKS